MTTWDMDTVHRVGRLGVRMYASAYEIAVARVDVLEHARRKAAMQIVDAAHALAVEVHPDDVSLVETEGPDDAVLVRLDMRWSPGWRDAGAEVQVELRGGAADGTLFAVRPQQLHQGIVLHKPMPSLNLADVDQIGPTRSLLSRTEHYQLAGWREVERRWVLACE